MKHPEFVNDYQSEFDRDAKMTLCNKTIILGVFLSLGCTNVEGRVGRIFGGESVTIDEYPYQASLHNMLGAHFCGGSIISEKHILTAAHCINQDRTTTIQYNFVVTGTSSSTGRAGKRHLISKIDVHPGWVPPTEGSKDAPLPNDLAVITLKDKIVFNEYQQKIDLPIQNFEEGHPANATGWGMASQTPEIFPEDLQMINTKLISVEECQQKITEPEVKIYNTHVCAFHSRGRGACSGDSGGPLAVNGKLVGVFSWIDGKYCAAGSPDVYTNVYKFKDYIENIMKNSD